MSRDTGGSAGTLASHHACGLVSPACSPAGTAANPAHFSRADGDKAGSGRGTRFRKRSVMLPVFITGSMLFTLKPEGQDWRDYLDQIRNRCEKAEALDVFALPACRSALA